MADRNYWVALFTATTWEEFMEADANTYGMRERYWNSLRRMQIGDYLICYVAGISRFIGLLEVTSKPFKSYELIWSYELFPCRISVKPLITLTFETAVPAQDLIGQLTLSKKLTNPSKWANLFRNSLRIWLQEDAKKVIEALKKAEKNPKIRPIDKYKLKRENLA